MRYPATIIDFGMGNLGSLRRSLEECGADPNVTDRPSDLRDARRIVLPGVGSFNEGMRHLNERGWPAEIIDAVRRRSVPLLGICLGMQLLAEKGHEGGEIEGLGLIGGQVPRLPSDMANLRIPHIGWNEVAYRHPDPVYEGIPSGTDFYFVHSYHLVPHSTEVVTGVTHYGSSFVSSVRLNRVFGVQFHPEKSQKAGLKFLRNFLAMTESYA